MQLTLLSTFARPAMAAGPVATRGPAAPSREAVAMSQLDRIAAQNLRGPVHGLGGTAMLLALVGGLVVLGSASMWRGPASEPQHEARKVVPTESVTAPPATVQTVQAATTAVAEATTPSVVVAAEPALHALATVEAAPPAVAAVDDAARKARAKQAAEARRKAAQLAQERALAEDAQRLQLGQQREAEQAQQQLDEQQARQRAAAEQVRAQSVQLAVNTRRSVGESCGAGSLLSRQFCRARECGKAEHQGDAVCVNMRDDELAQQRASINR